MLVKGERRRGGLLCVLLVQLPSRYIMCVRELTGGAESAVSREGHRGDLQVSWLSAQGGARGARQEGALGVRATVGAPGTSCVRRERWRRGL